VIPFDPENINPSVLRFKVSVPEVEPLKVKVAAIPVRFVPSPVNDPVNEPVNGSVSVLNCVDPDIVFMGSNGVTCALLDTTPLNLFVIEL
jgi:hypothetical protein